MICTRVHIPHGLVREVRPHFVAPINATPHDSQYNAFKPECSADRFIRSVATSSVSISVVRSAITATETVACAERRIVRSSKPTWKQWSERVCPYPPTTPCRSCGRLCRSSSQMQLFLYSKRSQLRSQSSFELRYCCWLAFPSGLGASSSQ